MNTIKFDYSTYLIEPIKTTIHFLSARCAMRVLRRAGTVQESILVLCSSKRGLRLVGCVLEVLVSDVPLTIFGHGLIARSVIVLVIT